MFKKKENEEEKYKIQFSMGNVLKTGRTHPRELKKRKKKRKRESERQKKFVIMAVSLS